MPRPTDSVRAFIAADISVEVRRRAALLIDDLRKGIQYTGSRPTWVKADNLHFTLYFLGQTPRATIEKIEQALAGISRASRPFTVQVSGLGVFPNPRRPSVLWIGVDHGRRLLRELQAEVLKRLMPLGYEPESRPFHPHLTLARIKSPRGAEGLMDVVHSHKDADCGVSEISRVVLYQSELRPEGAKYTPLRTWPL